MSGLAKGIAIGLLAFAAPAFAAPGEAPHANGEMQVAQILAGTPWDRLVDALEQGPGVRHWTRTASFPWPSFTADLGDGLGMLEVRGVGEDHRGSPVQVFYTIPADTCVPLEAVSSRWPDAEPFHGTVMPGGNSDPKDGLQLVDATLHRRVLYLVDPAQVQCLREVLVHDTRVQWGMSVEDVEKLPKK
jgi:hypothetical protein